MNKPEPNDQRGKLVTSLNIKRGDVWTVNLDPAIGSELQKTRPVIVVDSDSVGALPVKLVIPLTEWRDSYARHSWRIKVSPDRINRLKDFYG